LPEDLRRRALGLFLESKDVQEELQPCTNVEKPAVSLRVLKSLSLLRVVSEWPRNAAHTAARSSRRRRCREGNRHSRLRHSHLWHSRLRTPACGTPACGTPACGTPACQPPPPPCAARASIAASWLLAAQWWAAFLAQGDARKVHTVGLSHRQSHVRVCFDGFWPWPPTPPPPRMQSRARARARSRCCREITHVTARSQGQTQRRS
jgi:hypothetical protein